MVEVGYLYNHLQESCTCQCGAKCTKSETQSNAQRKTFCRLQHRISKATINTHASLRKKTDCQVGLVIVTLLFRLGALISWSHTAAERSSPLSIQFGKRICFLETCNRCKRCFNEIHQEWCKATNFRTPKLLNAQLSVWTLTLLIKHENMLPGH